MKRRDIIKRAGRNLRQAKGRTILTSLAIAVGSFTLTMALAAGQGTRNYADDLLKNNIDPQSMFIVKDKSLFEAGGTTSLQEYSEDIAASSGRPGATMKQLNTDDIKTLESVKNLSSLVPIYRLNPKYTSYEGNDKRFIAAIDYYDQTVLTQVKAGNVPPIGTPIGDGEIIIPHSYVESLGRSAQDMLGKKVSVTFVQQRASASQEQVQAALATGDVAAVQALLQPVEKVYEFRVRAVSKPSTMSFGGTPMMLISANKSKEINAFQTSGTEASGKYMGASGLAKKGVDPSELKKELEAKGYAVQTAKDAQGFLFTIVNTLQGIVGGFGLLALFASVFGIINTQYISVLERTSQIGLMKALGMPRRGIAKLFRYEAAWIGFLGGALGSLLAFILGTALNPQISKWLDIGDARLLDFVWWQNAILIGVLVLIAIVAGWLPARKAARLDPIEALRTE